MRLLFAWYEIAWTLSFWMLCNVEPENTHLDARLCFWKSTKKLLFCFSPHEVDQSSVYWGNVGFFAVESMQILWVCVFFFWKYDVLWNSLTEVFSKVSLLWKLFPLDNYELFAWKWDTQRWSWKLKITRFSFESQIFESSWAKSYWIFWFLLKME